MYFTLGQNVQILFIMQISHVVEDRFQGYIARANIS